MFFANPEEAFATIAANLRPGGRLLFTCWRAESENQWVTTPLADRTRLRAMLERAGFADITISPFDFPVCLATDGGVEAAVRMAMQIGPSATALAPHDRNGVVTLGGALWMVEALRRA